MLHGHVSSSLQDPFRVRVVTNQFAGQAKGFIKKCFQENNFCEYFCTLQVQFYLKRDFYAGITVESCVKDLFFVSGKLE